MENDMQAPQGHTGEVVHTEPVPGIAVAEDYETFLGMDSYAWVAATFLVFLLLLWKVGAFRAIGSALDKQAEKVKADLAEAAALRAEAEAMKADAAQQAAQAEADAKAVIVNAEAEAQRILEQAGRDADAQIVRRTRLAQDRIAADVRQAEADLRARAADITLQAAESLLAGRQDALGELTDSAIATLDRRV